MFSYVFSNSFNAFKRSPVRIYGFMLLKTLMVSLAYFLGILPIISLPIVLLIDAGMSMVFLDVYNFKDAESKRLLSGFKSAKRVGSGMLWRWLWISVWTISGSVLSFLIPVLGIVACLALSVMGVYKSYCYAFTPYILMEDENADAMSALNKSKDMTNGFKGWMFLTDLILVAIPIVYYILVILIAVGVSSSIATGMRHNALGMLWSFGTFSGMASVLAILFWILILAGVVLIFAVNTMRGIAQAGYYNYAAHGAPSNMYGYRGYGGGYNRNQGGYPQNNGRYSGNNGGYPRNYGGNMGGYNSAPNRPPQQAPVNPQNGQQANRNQPPRQIYGGNAQNAANDGGWVEWNNKSPQNPRNRMDNYPGGAQRNPGAVHSAAGSGNVRHEAQDPRDDVNGRNSNNANQ